ncbi:MAG: tRNA lysidine(34) synthetase TilS, partial [Muribaculaceae bacterium]|nr:tRNA lysidine(34) synthetase TilS [Muribaculaceae bacterium]
MDELEHKVLQSIARHRLIADDTRPVIVGLSGGADSVALLATLTALGYRCVAAHCNFGLRGEESIRDRDHSRAIADRLGCEWITTEFNTRAYMLQNGISLEMACRDLRYNWFAEQLNALGAQAIAVAHHRDDNIETLMLNLLRGSGIRGLRGMRPRNGDIIRPLLECTRSDITAYLERRAIPYITDSSNLENDVARNRLRNIVLPCIYREFPQAPDTISRTIAILAGTEPV